MRDLSEVRTAYERGDGTLRELAERFSVPIDTIKKRAAREKWHRADGTATRMAPENLAPADGNGTPHPESAPSDHENGTPPEGEGAGSANPEMAPPNQNGTGTPNNGTDERRAQAPKPENGTNPEPGQRTEGAVPGMDGAGLPRRPGITADTLQRAGIRIVDEPEPGSIEIPYVDIDGQPTGFKRWRLARERASGQKYHQEAGSGIHVYHPPIGPSATAGGDLVLVEGEFKSLSLAEAGITAIGLPGITTYTRTAAGEPVLLPGIRTAIERRKPARILFLGDSDTATNLAFARNAVELAKSIHPLPVILPRLPLAGPGKGIDDCRQSLDGNFEGFWRGIIEDAEPVDPKAGAGTLAARLLERERETIAAATGAERDRHQRRMVRMVAECHDDPVAEERLARLAADIFNLGIRAVRSGAKLERERICERVRADDPAASDDLPAQFEEVTKAYGPPAFRDPEGGGQINQPFWAGLYSKDNLVLHEPDERRFYQYEHLTGAWRHITVESIEQNVSTRLLGVARKHRDTLGFLERCRGLRTLQAIAGHLRGIVEERAPFDRRRRIIHCANQMLEFEGDSPIPIGKPFSPEFYSRNPLPLAFDPDAECPRFLDRLLLPAVSPEDASLIQRWFGCAILQRNIPQRLLLLDGQPGRGKSLLAIIARMLVGASNTASLRTRLLEERFELYRIAQKTLLIGADVPGNFLMHQGASRLKALVGGDPLEAEAKNSNESFTLYGDFNVLVTCNERLTVRLESDVGAWRRRLLLVRFEVPAPNKRVTQLAERLMQLEGPGILKWAVQGAIDLLHELNETGDYHLTEAQRRRIDDILAESSSLEVFIKERVEQHRGSDLTKDEIEEAYAVYCGRRTFAPVAVRRQQHLIPELMLQFHRVAESNSIQRQSPIQGGATKNHRGYRNVRLKPEEPEQP